MTLYGEPSPALAEAIESLAGKVTFRQFSFFQALDPDVEAAEKVSAESATHRRREQR
jgi:hypothetical protein